jgi:hypothetical protein
VYLGTTPALAGPGAAASISHAAAPRRTIEGVISGSSSDELRACPTDVESYQAEGGRVNAAAQSPSRSIETRPARVDAHGEALYHHIEVIEAVGETERPSETEPVP